MAGYEIFFKKSVWKDFKTISDKDLSMILERIELLRDNPRQQHCIKLSGQEKYRLRCGKYRIIYSIQDNELTVWVVKVGHRKDVYK